MSSTPVKKSTDEPTSVPADASPILAIDTSKVYRDALGKCGDLYDLHFQGAYLHQRCVDIGCFFIGRIVGRKWGDEWVLDNPKFWFRVYPPVHTSNLFVKHLNENKKSCKG